jgi:hypothetical protein
MYSANKTGFEHLTPQEGGETNAKEMFEQPEGAMDTDYFVLQNPLNALEMKKKICKQPLLF